VSTTAPAGKPVTANPDSPVLVIVPRNSGVSDPELVTVFSGRSPVSNLEPIVTVKVSVLDASVWTPLLPPVTPMVAFERVKPQVLAAWQAHPERRVRLTELVLDVT